MASDDFTRLLKPVCIALYSHGGAFLRDQNRTIPFGTIVHFTSGISVLFGFYKMASFGAATPVLTSFLVCGAAGAAQRFVRECRS